MTDLERINEKLQRQIDAQNARIDNTLTKIDMMLAELRDSRTEMRDRDNQRATEIRDRDNQRAAETRELQTRFYTKIDALDAKIDALGKHVQNLTVAAIVGFSAVLVAVGGLVVATISK